MNVNCNDGFKSHPKPIFVVFKLIRVRPVFTVLVAIDPCKSYSFNKASYFVKSIKPVS